MGKAVDALGIESEDLRFRTAYWNAIGRDRFRSRIFDQYATQPLEIPYILSHVARAALEDKDSLHKSLIGLVVKMDERVWRGMFDTNDLDATKKRVEEADAPLALAIEEIWRARERRRPPRDRTRVAAQLERLPRDVREAAAIVVLGALRAEEWRTRAFEGLPELDGGQAGRDLVRYLSVQEGAQCPPGIERYLDRVDFAALCAGAEDLALAIDSAREAMADRKTTETFRFQCATPLGDIVLRAGPGEGDAPIDEAPLLLIDLDGDDTYHALAAAVGPDRPVSVAIDCGGNDRYLAPGGTQATSRPLVGAFGAGIMGYGVLIDLAGNDRYEANAVAQGGAILGVGVLMDYAGDDSYDAVVHSQGAASFGMGMLADLAGNDSYRAFMMSQAMGFTRGAGLLRDTGDGNDTYLLRNDELRWPSAQAPRTHNSSMGQGAGYGRRADVGDGRSWAGGYGLLIDEGGDDSYRANVFAQGTAYWFGLGFLIDMAGDDSYSAHWYCQGGPAHYAVGALIDYAGDDRYHCDIQVAQGGAHDWSVGWLLDASGDDLYETGELSLGSANANALGFFMDLAGDDTYRAMKKRVRHSLGGARMSLLGSLREAQTNAGLFVDLDGDDDYTSFSRAANNALWVEPELRPGAGLPIDWGAGIDTRCPGKPPLRYLPYTERKK